MTMNVYSRELIHHESPSQSVSQTGAGAAGDGGGESITMEAWNVPQ